MSGAIRRGSVDAGDPETYETASFGLACVAVKHASRPGDTLEP